MSKEIKLATGAQIGRDPTPQSIAEGTVRWTEHPDYQNTLTSLRKEGFIVTEGSSAFVVFRLIKNVMDGNSSQVYKAISAMRDMRWLDFEHELIHVDQIMSRFILQGCLFFTDEVQLQKGKGKTEKSPFVIHNWQNTVTEFHARLIEFLNLTERGCSDELLLEHAEGLSHWADIFWKKGTSKWRSPSKMLWIKTYFPDIFELRIEASKIVRSKFPYLPRIY